MSVLTKLLTTLAYVTTLPTGTQDYPGQNMHGLARYLPAAGLIIGTLAGLAGWLLYKIHSEHLFAACLLVFILVLITGALHLDGLMDAADGICSHRDRNRMLEIMKDSRTGNFGALAGILIILLKITALNALPFHVIPYMLPVICSWSRWCELIAISCCPYLREEGLGKLWHQTSRTPDDFLLGGLLPLAASLVLIVHTGNLLLVILPATVIASGFLAILFFQEYLGGQTGDTYGAVVELAEAFGLGLLALIYPLLPPA